MTIKTPTRRSSPATKPTWTSLKDQSLADLDNLQDPDILANEIIENLEAGLDNFREIMEVINGDG